MHPSFNEFINKMTQLVSSAKNDEEKILSQGERFLADLVAQDNWLPEEFAKPHPDYYQQYLLYSAPDKSFSVVSFVWGPGQSTPVHDHTVWGLIGMLRGSEIEESYKLGDLGQPVKKLGTQQLNPGDVGKVSPTIGDIHKVSNAYDDRVSISIHVYGADIGEVSRHVFNENTSESKTFISGYAN